MKETSTTEAKSKMKSGTDSSEKNTSSDTVTGLLIGKNHNYGIRLRVLSENRLQLIVVHRMEWSRTKKVWEPVEVEVVHE